MIRLCLTVPQAWRVSSREQRGRFVLNLLAVLTLAWLAVVAVGAVWLLIPVLNHLTGESRWPM